MNSKIPFWFIVFGAACTSLCSSSRSDEFQRVATAPGDWRVLAWDKNDGQFRQARADVNNMISLGVSEKVVAEFKSRYLLAKKGSSQKCAVLAFSWLYAAYLKEFNEHKKSRELPEASSVVFREPIPIVYDYVRLRFILDQRSFPRKENRMVGQKLVDTNPSDYVVKYHFCSLLAPDVSLSDRVKAKKYAADLIKMCPKVAAVYLNHASIYETIWFATKTKADAGQALWGYRKYVSLARKDSPARAVALKRIKDFESRV